MEDVGLMRFNTCRNRSKETYSTHVGRTCCGGTPGIQEGYACFVFPDLGNNIKPEICGFCRKYKAKLPETNNNI